MSDMYAARNAAQSWLKSTQSLVTLINVTEKHWLMTMLHRLNHETTAPSPTMEVELDGDNGTLNGESRPIDLLTAVCSQC